MLALADAGFINAGHGNLIPANRVIAVVGVETAPMKRYIDRAEESGMLITISQGRKWRSAIIMDTNHVVLCSLQPETINNRVIAARIEMAKASVLSEDKNK